MKKVFFMFLLLGFFKGTIHAQPKQQKMLLQQIAALQVYIGYAQKGYSAVKKGLTIVGHFKRGEFNLHTDYINSLKAVNPKIKKYERVAEITALQIKIIKIYKNLYQQIRHDDLFHGDEVDYIKRVFERVLENSESSLDALQTIITDEKLALKDNERILRIAMIYQNMLDNYTFSARFSNQIRTMALSKAMELKEAETSRTLSGIN